jgi:hypothetical protein
MGRDLPVVHTAGSVEEARVVAAWLEQQGVETFVKDTNVIGALGYATPAFAPRGIEICVVDEAVAERARTLLAERARTPTPADANAPGIEARCEECGRTASFPASQRGTVQSCPYCGAYIDIVDDSRA